MSIKISLKVTFTVKVYPARAAKHSLCRVNKINLTNKNVILTDDITMC
jgi:hypothetical protein